MTPPIKYHVSIGAVFHRLTVVQQMPNARGGSRQFLCRCSCGNEVTGRPNDLHNGVVKSCGCLNRELLKAAHDKKAREAKKVRAGQPVPEYTNYMQMRARCLNPKSKPYANYGGRGIKICDRWLESYENFLADMGRRPTPGHSIDRWPDMNGNYEPSNCRWATKQEQGRNTRSVRLTDEIRADIDRRTAAGETRTSIAAHYGVSIFCVSAYLTKRTWREEGEVRIRKWYRKGFEPSGLEAGALGTPARSPLARVCDPQPVVVGAPTHGEVG